jgi:VWFA-related protein
MTACRGSLAFGLVAALGWPVSAGQVGPQTTFRVQVDIVPVAAVVRDRKGRNVAGLHADDFVVIDAGERRPMLSFAEDAASPVSLAVLVDESGSMRGNRDTARHAVSALLGELGATAVPGDEVALVAFGSTLREVQSFTSDLARVHAGLDRVETYGATAVHDAIAATARELVSVQGRRAMVVVTDGLDTCSRLTLAEVSGIASAIDVPVYVALIKAGGDAAGRAPALQPLWDLARWTGGEAFVVSEASAARNVAGRIVSDVRHQYLIAFESASEPGWRLLEIRTTQPGLAVRARSAYVAGGGQDHAR